MRRWLLLVGLSMVVGVVYGQGMWLGTRAGMTSDQVIALVPNATRPSDTTFTGFDSWPGMQLLVKADNVVVLGASGVARFGFIDGRLEREVLTFTAGRTDDSVAETQCDTFRAALRSKYGAEGSSKQTQSPMGLSALWDFKWFAGQTEIELSCAFVTNANFQGISYQFVGTSGL